METLSPGEWASKMYLAGWKNPFALAVPNNKIAQVTNVAPDGSFARAGDKVKEDEGSARMALKQSWEAVWKLLTPGQNGGPTAEAAKSLAGSAAEGVTQGFKTITFIIMALALFYILAVIGPFIPRKG